MGVFPEGHAFVERRETCSRRFCVTGTPFSGMMIGEWDPRADIADKKDRDRKDPERITVWKKKHC